AQRALHVVLASGIKQLLEVWVVQRPPELPTREDLGHSPFLPARPLVGAEHDLTGETHGDDFLLLIATTDGDEVADTPLGQLALDARHPGATRSAVRPDGVEEDAGVADVLTPVCLLAPLELDDQVIIAVFLLGGEVAEAIPTDVDHPLTDPEHLARVLAFGV